MSVEHGKFIPPDENITRFSTGHHVQQVEVNEGFIVVDDPQLGSFTVGNNNTNNIYYDLFTTDDHYRSGGVSQLSKRDFHATIPNTASFKRDWHNLALYRIVDYFSHQQGLNEEQKLALVLKVCLPDRGHMDFSHALESAMEEYSRQENWHESLWSKVAQVGGTAEVLDRYAIKYGQDFTLPGIKIPSWAECPAPDVNADRFQYTVTELLLWFDNDQAPPEVRELVKSICSPEVLTITDEGKFAFNDIEAARIFAKGYLLLTTEHWNDPINRVQLHLLVETAKRAVVKRRIPWMETVDKGQTRYPDDYYLGIDQDIVDAMQTSRGNRDDFMFAVNNLLNSISMQERERFVSYKINEYSAFLLDTHAHDYPSELLEPKRVEFGPPSSQISVDTYFASDGAETGSRIPTLRNESGICYDLHPLKNRFVDPLVLDARGRAKPLSELDSNYANLLREQQRVRSASVVVHLALAGEFEAAFKEGITENNADFTRLLHSGVPTMTLDQRRRLIKESATRANAAAIKAGTLIMRTAE